MSAFHPIATEQRTQLYDGSVPVADQLQRSKMRRYWMKGDQISEFDLFDHLGGGDKSVWHAQAQRLRGFEVDDQIKFGRLLDGDVAWLCPRRTLST